MPGGMSGQTDACRVAVERCYTRSPACHGSCGLVLAWQSLNDCLHSLQPCGLTGGVTVPMQGHAVPMQMLQHTLQKSVVLRRPQAGPAADRGAAAGGAVAGRAVCAASQGGALPVRHVPPGTALLSCTCSTHPMARQDRLSCQPTASVTGQHTLKHCDTGTGDSDAQHLVVLPG